MTNKYIEIEMRPTVCGVGGSFSTVASFWLDTFKAMECPSMKFEHGISDFMIAGVKITSDKICLNYDRKGNILIGMDILKDWDIHIGVSKVTGKSLFLACPIENKCREYIDALERHFGIL